MDPKRRKTGDQDISELRLASRQKYLAEREAQQLALLRLQVDAEAEDEARLGSKLSEREKKEFARNRQTLSLAEARQAIDEHLDGYRLPDSEYSNKTEVLTKRHNDKESLKSEVQLWEEEQIGKIKSQIKKPERVQEDDYEYVFDVQTQVSFQADPSSRLDPDKKALQDQLDAAEKKAKTIEETQKSLPVYHYRETLLKAMEEHQTIVVVGETVSRARPELRILILSATINAKHFADFFAAPVLNIPGRAHPVSIYYTSAPEANYLSAAITTVFQIHIAADLPGDILVFLTGEEEIISAQENIESTMKKLRGKVKELIICPLYSALPPDVQAKVFEPTPPNSRKVILATNIAETSITIDGTKHVIDCGFAKESNFNPSTGISSLVVSPISRASANQRAGRAGRTSAGFCYRLYTRFAFYNEMSETTEPELQRTGLDGVVLTLKGLGISNLLDFEFLDPPSPNSIIKSLEGLYALGALDSAGTLTRMGRKMAELPLDIKLSKAILESEKYGCREEMLSIVSVLGESASLFMRPKDKRVAADAARARFSTKDEQGGDFLTYLNIWLQFEESGFDPRWCSENFLQFRSLSRARDVRDQLVKLCERVELAETSAGSDHVAIRKCLTAGFFPNAARLQRDGLSYRTLSNNGMTVFIHPSSSLSLAENRPKWVVYAELVETTKEYIRSVLPINPDWLVEVAPHIHSASSISKLGDNKKMPKERTKTGTGYNLPIKSATASQK
ncbi:pre-mRNA splicing factor ATP-dependent RNA helicase PRP16 [Cucurbitaria berberidis CBS 394.84]|uniref:RNA helicase n=1 Tax=Cucurbitaria berberidis CBS 394.84 TaxID=1168544 RepID=A0A9P4GND8_9PLEO|nr:pre-mRNA splicing factor ATP-dependent RNA helicase PRP16 [Cucurbitaria berberidis CBS 394.84]KAF1848379.1 pre-mRNA splicing factor ATP-dependent RNA helicase PRP16 [Cucurbitaria berberidis CBS 394.84]